MSSGSDHHLSSMITLLLQVCGSSQPSRWPSPARSGEPRLAPAARYGQPNDDPAPTTRHGPPLLGRPGQDLSRLEALLVIVTPDTVLRWQRRRFRDYWTSSLAARPGGPPAVAAEIKTLIAAVALA